MGGHEFALHFEPHAINATAKVGWLSFQMKTEFVDCEDSKVCLQALFDAGADGIELRNNNHLQLTCLESVTPSDIPACASWRSCLSSEYTEKLKSMLQAATLHSRTASRGQASLLSARTYANDSRAHGDAVSNGDGACLDPETEDPESWACDCADTAIKRCTAISHADNYDKAKCLTAMYCDYPHVCTTWADEACSDATVVAMRNLLHANALEQRRGATRDWRSPSDTLALNELTKTSYDEGRAAARKKRAQEELLVNSEDQSLDETLAVKQCA